MEKDNTTQTSNVVNIVDGKEMQNNTPIANNKIVRKFEIQVFDLDYEKDDTNPELRPVRTDKAVIIEATSKEELQSKLSLYKQCGQIAKIVREIDPPSAMTTQNSAPQVTLTPANAQTQQPQQAICNVDEKPICHVEKTINIRQTHCKPKYYKVGDIEIKDDNGKLYQKQWMRLTDSEASNLRIINDKNNSTVNLAGKHFEMKKWILVENNDDESTSLEDSLK